MFEDLRAAFREAIDNFNKELQRETSSEAADRLLLEMKREITDEQAQILSLEQQLAIALATAAREQELSETCRRRERMARDIDDELTATLAAHQAAKHEGHRAVLEKKVDALREELAFRRSNAEEMIAKFGEAKQQRDAHRATSGRASARATFETADDLFSELDRMADRIEGDRASAEAAEAFSYVELDFDTPSPPREDLDVDAALAELKRRMGRSG
jgi:phage shock protein A